MVLRKASGDCFETASKLLRNFLENKEATFRDCFEACTNELSLRDCFENKEGKNIPKLVLIVIWGSRFEHLLEVDNVITSEGHHTRANRSATTSGAWGTATAEKAMT